MLVVSQMLNRNPCTVLVAGIRLGEDRVTDGVQMDMWTYACLNLMPSVAKRSRFERPRANSPTKAPGVSQFISSATIINVGKLHGLVCRAHELLTEKSCTNGDYHSEKTPFARSFSFHMICMIKNFVRGSILGIRQPYKEDQS